MKRIQYNLFKRKKDEKHYVWYYSYTDPFTGIRKQKRCKDCETLKEARIYVDSLPKYEMSNLLLSLEKLKHLYKSEDLGLCFLLMVSRGIRLGEAIALTWEAVDFERGGILVFQQWGKLDGISAPKKNEYRSIVVPEKILALLKEFKNKKNPKADDFCFESPLGNHLSLSQFSILSKTTEELIQKKLLLIVLDTLTIPE